VKKICYLFCVIFVGLLFACKKEKNENEEIENLFLLALVTLPRCDYSITAANKTQTITIPSDAKSYAICAYDNGSTPISFGQAGKYTMKLKSGNVLVSCRGNLSGSRNFSVPTQIVNTKSSSNDIIFPSSAVSLNRTIQSDDKISIAVSGISSNGFSCGVTSAASVSLTSPSIMTFSIPSENGVPNPEGETLSGSCDRAADNTCNDWFSKPGTILSPSNYCSGVGGSASTSGCLTRGENINKTLVAICLFSSFSLASKSYRYYFAPTFTIATAKTDCDSLKGGLSEP